MRHIVIGLFLLVACHSVKADEDMPEFVAVEMKDTSLILPNSPQHVFVPTDKLDGEIIYLDSLLSLKDAPKKSIIWLQIGDCDSTKISHKKSIYGDFKVNHVRIKCWDPESRYFRTIYLNAKGAYKSENGNQMEKMAETFYQKPSTMDRFLKPKRDPKAYENGKHFKAVENIDLWTKKE